MRLQIDRWGAPSPRKVEAAVEVLHKGGVAAYPTDSIYALGCAIEARDAIERIYRAKGMHKNQRLALICPDLSTASEFGIFSQTAFRIAQRIFPGPYTLVVPATRAVPKTLTDSKRRTVGIRITSHPVAQALAKGLGRPLLTSSAIAPDTGEPCHDAEEMLAAFGKHIDVLVDYDDSDEDERDHAPNIPSTVIAIDGDDITLIRRGQGSLEGIIDAPDEEPVAEAAPPSGKRRSAR
ncbi:MAG: threonylcarbamoyl-AMP synthase [Deltaproteobacteria bacterium]|nr:threonylcarbamoyl-AMP synthase [Deltaproteobacteria bacterium]MCW5808090.1 threonylcarbamoyl-AMP synthase [Deltaproteobacteria bacterium]